MAFGEEEFSNGDNLFFIQWFDFELQEQTSFWRRSLAFSSKSWRCHVMDYHVVTSQWAINFLCHVP